VLISRRKRIGKIRNKQTSIVSASWVAVTLGAIGGLGVVPGSALAQTPSPLGEWQYSVGIPLQKMWQPNIPDWQVRVGAATSFQPRYEGSDRYHVMAGPSVDVRYKDLFFFSSGEGLGVNFAQGQNWRASLAAVYDLGRRGHDDPEELNGLGNINQAPGVKLSGEYVVSKDFPLVLRADVRRYFGGSNGWIGDLGAYMPLPGSTQKILLVRRAERDRGGLQLHEQLVRRESEPGGALAILGSITRARVSSRWVSALARCGCSTSTGLPPPTAHSNNWSAARAIVRLRIPGPPA
jgi:Outer membrane protein V